MTSIYAGFVQARSLEKKHRVSTGTMIQILNGEGADGERRGGGLNGEGVGKEWRGIFLLLVSFNSCFLFLLREVLFLFKDGRT